MMTDTTRRSLLRLGTGALAYGAGAAAIAGGVALAGEAKGATLPADRRAFDRAFAAYRAAVKASEDYAVQIEEPALAEVERRAPFAGCFFDIKSRDGKTIRHRWSPDDPDAYETHPPSSPLIPAAREVRRAFEANQQARVDLGIKNIMDRSNDLYEAISPIEDALFATPAPDLAAVCVKLDLLWNDERDSIRAYEKLVRDDVRRLSGGEA